MKRNHLALTIFLLSLFIITSCGKTDKTGLLVPKDAFMVLHINAGSLSSKLSWKDIQSSEWFQNIHKEDMDMDSVAELLVKDPTVAGIDLDADIVYFMKARATGAYNVFDGKLKDAAKFEAFIKKARPAGTESKDGSLTFFSGDEGTLAVWDDKRYAIIHDNPTSRAERMFNTDGNSPGLTMKPMSIDSLKAFGKGLLNLSGSDGLGIDERFSTLIAEKGDIHLWLNVSALMNNETAYNYLSMMKVGDLLDGNATAMTLNFDNGKVEFNSKHYYGKQLSSLMEKFSAKPVDAALINRLPADNLLAVVAINYSPDAVKELFKISGIDGLANGFLSKSNYSIDDFVNGNKGEMLFALTNLNFTSPPNNPMEETMPKKPEPSFLFANAIKNKPAFDKLLHLVLGEGDEDDVSKHIPGFNYKIQGDWFVASNDASDVDKFLAGPNNHVAFADRISGHPIGIFVDIHKIIVGVKNEVTSNDEESYTAALNMWEDLLITGADFKNNYMSFHAELNLVNKTDNSLKQLNNYASAMSAINKKKIDRMENNMLSDTTSARKAF